MDIVIVIYLFVLGLVFGSFYNVIGLRIPMGESFVWSRSQCPTCKRLLTTVELIPLLSFFLQKGRCRSCRQRISALYPTIELITGVLFVVAYFLVGLTTEIFVALLLISLLMIVIVSDIRYMIISDRVLLFFLPIFLLLRYTIAQPQNLWEPLVGILIGFLLLWLIRLISRNRMGGGDVKLFAVLGSVLGLNGVLLAFFLSCFFGAFIGVAGMMIGKIKKGQPIPFGPFIALGSVVTYFFGTYLLELYLNLF